jgi:hypothetical protein
MSGAGFAEGENEFQMTAPKTERNIDPKGRSLRKLGDTTPLFSEKAEKASATARGGPERPLRFDRNRITF